MRHTWHLWLCEANYRAAPEMEGLPLRPHVLAYQAPVTSLTEGGPVILPPHARTVSCACELAVELDRALHRADEDGALAAIRGYRVLAAFRDSSLIEEVPLPTPRDVGVCAYYARWADTFNCAGPLVPAGRVETPYGAAMHIEIVAAAEALGPAHSHTSGYLHRAPAVLSALSRFATLQPGDVVSLGRAGALLVVPAGRHLPAGSRVLAEIAGIGRLETTIEDRRAAIGRPADR